MVELAKGALVRIDIPDEIDPDFEAYHGKEGEIVAIIDDDASMTTGRMEDDALYRVALVDERTADFRARDLRPAIGRNKEK